MKRGISTPDNKMEHQLTTYWHHQSHISAIKISSMQHNTCSSHIVTKFEFFCSAVSTKMFSLELVARKSIKCVLIGWICCCSDLREPRPNNSQNVNACRCPWNMRFSVRRFWFLSCTKTRETCRKKIWTLATNLSRIRNSMWPTNASGALDPHFLTVVNYLLSFYWLIIIICIAGWSQNTKRMKSQSIQHVTIASGAQIAAQTIFTALSAAIEKYILSFLQKKKHIPYAIFWEATRPPTNTLIKIPNFQCSIIAAG